MNSKTAVKSVIFASIACLGTGCAHHMVRNVAAEGPLGAPPPAAQAPAAVAGPTEVMDANAEPSMRGDVMRSIPELKTVHFDFDKSFLTPEARQILAGNSQWLKEHEDVRVQVTGNCDQRGTVAYNLALGQRRAAEVREYYRHMGVPANRIATISYGKEKLLCQESNETCWQKNRRAETLAASPTVATVK